MGAAAIANTAGPPAGGSPEEAVMTLTSACRWAARVDFFRRPRSWRSRCLPCVCECALCGNTARHSIDAGSTHSQPPPSSIRGRTYKTALCLNHHKNGRRHAVRSADERKAPAPEIYGFSTSEDEHDEPGRAGETHTPSFK